jgi:hypothetical protein
VKAGHGAGALRPTGRRLEGHFDKRCYGDEAAQHAAALTRDTVTPAVHYVRFPFSEAQVNAFATVPEVALAATHPDYQARTTLSPEVREELLGDLRGTTKPLPMG